MIFVRAPRDKPSPPAAATTKPAPFPAKKKTSCYHTNARVAYKIVDANARLLMMIGPFHSTSNEERRMSKHDHDVQDGPSHRRRAPPPMGNLQDLKTKADSENRAHAANSSLSSSNKNNSCASASPNRTTRRRQTAWTLCRQTTTPPFA